MAPELFTASAICAALGIHPFTTYPASLAFLARVRPRRNIQKERASTARAALCVSAYNEAGIIRAKAENMLQMRAAWPGLELLVYVDAATDGTADDPARIRRSHPRRGRGRAARKVAWHEHAGRGDGRGARDLLRCQCDVRAGCGSGPARRRSPIPRSAAYAASSSTASRRGARPPPRARSTGGSRSASRRLRRAPGPRWGLTDRSSPSAVHCIDPPPETSSTTCMCRSRSYATAIGVVREPAALAYEETVSRPGEEFRRKIRIACQAFNVHRLLRPRLRMLPALDRYKYVSHKLLRWFSGVFLALAALTFLAGLAALASWILLLVCVGLGLVLLALGDRASGEHPGAAARYRRRVRGDVDRGVPLVARRSVPDLDPAGLRTVRRVHRLSGSCAAEGGRLRRRSAGGEAGGTAAGRGPRAPRAGWNAW